MKYICLFILAAGLSACAVPKRFSTLPRPGHPGESPFGARIDWGNYRYRSGELLAVSDSTLWVLRADSVVQFSRHSMPDMTVYIMRTNEKYKTVGWLAAGSMAPTLGHGYYLLVSGPATLLVGAILSNQSVNGTYSLRYPEEVGWDDLYRYARYPQGFPGG